MSNQSVSSCKIRLYILFFAIKTSVKRCEPLPSTFGLKGRLVLVLFFCLIADLQLEKKKVNKIQTMVVMEVNDTEKIKISQIVKEFYELLCSCQLTKVQFIVALMFVTCTITE